MPVKERANAELEELICLKRLDFYLQTSHALISVDKHATTWSTTAPFKTLQN
jgi:hypothetical protein